MKRTALLAGLVVVALTACNGDVEDAIRAELKDPYSAKFEKVLRVKTRACARYNAKNSYGAFAGEVTAQLLDTGTAAGGKPHWTVESTDESDCSVDELQRRLAIDSLDKSSEAAVLAALKANNLAPESATFVFEAVPACRQFAEDVLTKARIANEEVDEKEKAEWQAEFDAGMAKLKAGTCSDDSSASDASDAAETSDETGAELSDLDAAQAAP